MEKIIAFFVTAILVIAIALAGSFIGGLFFMLVWNAIMPDLFHLPELGFLQSVGLVFLISYFKSSTSSSSK